MTNNNERPIQLQLRPSSITLAPPTTNCGSTKAALSSASGDSLPSQILPHLFVGNQEQTNKDTLNRLNISYILSLGLLPLISNNLSPSSAGIATTTAPTTTTTSTGTTTTSSNNQNHQYHRNHNHDRQSPKQHHSNDHKQLNSNQRQQQQNLLPSKNSSKDFKIRLRSSASNTSNHYQQSNEPLLSSSSSFLSNNISSSNGNNSPSRLDRPTSSKSQSNGENKGLKAVRYIQCKCINITDNSEQMLTKFFDEAHQFIDEARRKKCNILVHCLAGISRSPTIAIAYLMKVNLLRLQDAYNLVKQCRPQIDPNFSFMGQLMIYEKRLENREKDKIIKSSNNNLGKNVD